MIYDLDLDLPSIFCFPMSHTNKQLQRSDTIRKRLLCLHWLKNRNEMSHITHHASEPPHACPPEPPHCRPSNLALTHCMLNGQSEASGDASGASSGDASYFGITRGGVGGHARKGGIS